MKISKTHLLLAISLSAFAAPAFVGASKLEAKPKQSAPAYGYRGKEEREKRRGYLKERREERKSLRDQENNTRASYRSREGSRRYRIMYRTRYNKNGQPYRVYSRVYY